MQLYALDQGVPVVAASAKRHRSYLCPECGALLRLRAGPSRQAHFYHERSPQKCRQSGKTLEHLQAQLDLVRLIAQARMEEPFSAIGRIADVAWHEARFVFEVQCSPLSLEEAKERSADYKSIGYTVVWLLHDKRFNRSRLCAAEEYLRSTQMCYFTNIDKQGKGVYYDQFEIIERARRLLRGCPLPIKLLSWQPLVPREGLAVPVQLAQRYAHWPFAMEGDLLMRIDSESQVASLERVEHSYLLQRQSKANRLPLPTLLKRLVRLLWDKTLSRIAAK